MKCDPLAVLNDDTMRMTLEANLAKNKSSDEAFGKSLLEEAGDNVVLRSCSMWHP